ncbi:AAA family ATPase [Methanococcoides sp. SA1]|nr:AAA family ATPase [Methanococcoides sp. SA1]
MEHESINFSICNCNNISSADIEIKKQFLNIKYAANGTGKSTIAKIIQIASKEEKLDDFHSYGSDENPSFTSDKPIDNVFVFDEEFVNSIVFQESEVIGKSFEVFIKSQDYDQKVEALNSRLQHLRNYLKEDPEIIEMRRTFSNVASKIKLNTDKQIRNNPFIKSLLKEENIFNVPDNLIVFRPFIESNYHIDWIDWKNKGFQFDDINKCPFCTEDLKADYDIEKSTFQKSYKKSNAKDMKDMLSFFEALQEYICEQKYELLNECIKSSSDEDTILKTLAQFMDELSYAEKKWVELVNFDSHCIKRDEVSNLGQILTNLKLIPSIFDVFDSTKMQSIISRVNDNIDSLLVEINNMRSEIGSLKKKIEQSAEIAKKDINSFLETAGINYEIEIDLVAENESKTILKYKDRDANSHDVDNIKKRLSWGEKNAFALVLFMHYATSAGANLIILDDPISSFDSNKKYAIINRLFESNQNDRTFLKKTVLLLTHDFEPVLDFIVNGKPTSECVSATYLVNQNGIVSETKINKYNVLPQIKLLNTIIDDDQFNDIHRLVAIRKLIDHTLESDDAINAYGIISSLIHGDEVPYNKINDKRSFMGTTKIVSGTAYIKNRIPSFSYEQVRDVNLTSESLIRAYANEPCSYLKLQLFRVFLEIYGRRKDTDDALLKYIDETYHIENDYLYALDFRKFDIVPSFIMKKCEKYMESNIERYSIN